MSGLEDMTAHHQLRHNRHWLRLWEVCVTTGTTLVLLPSSNWTCGRRAWLCATGNTIWPLKKIGRYTTTYTVYT